MITLSEMKSTDTVFDLGSGDGRVLMECAKVCKKAIGYEINLFLVAWTMIKIMIGQQSKVDVKWQDYNKAKFNDATIIFLYSIRGFIPKLQEKLKKELRPGTKIISYKFPLSGLKLIKKTKTDIYLYLVK